MRHESTSRCTAAAKGLGLLVLALAALALAACGGDEEKASPTPQPSPTAAPTPISSPAVETPTLPPAGETPTVVPSWETSAPREPVPAGQAVDLALRNKYGEADECHDFQVEVKDPLSAYASTSETVCADEWTNLTYEDTSLAGTYEVRFYVEGQFVAEDSFEVSE
jgi:hypothetical protein